MYLFDRQRGRIHMADVGEGRTAFERTPIAIRLTCYLRLKLIVAHDIRKHGSEIGFIDTAGFRANSPVHPWRTLYDRLAPLAQAKADRLGPMTLKLLTRRESEDSETRARAAHVLTEALLDIFMRPK